MLGALDLSLSLIIKQSEQTLFNHSALDLSLSLINKQSEQTLFNHSLRPLNKSTCSDDDNTE